MKTPFLPLPCRSFETHTQSFQLASPVTAGTFLLNDLTWTSSASSLFRISRQTFLLVLFPSFSYYSWFSTLDSNLRVGRLSSWIFFYSLWVQSEQTFWQQKGVRSSGSLRMSVTMEFMQRRQAGLPATACSPSKPAKLWSQEKQRLQPEPWEVKKNNSRFFLCQPITLLNPKVQRNNMADCWNFESTHLWHWDREHFSLLLFNYLFPYTLSEGLWFKEWLFSFKIFKLKDQISHERPSSAFNILSWPWELQMLS